MSNLWKSMSSRTKGVTLLALLTVVASMFLVVLNSTAMLADAETGQGGMSFPASEVPCFREAVEGSNPLMQRVGNCEFTQEEYKSAPVHSFVVKHSVAGPNYLVRLLVNAMHIFGALMCLSLITVFFSARRDSKVADFASRVLLRTVYTMMLTGVMLYLLKDPGDLGFFPRPEPAHDSALLRYAYLGMFGLSFINSIAHMSLDKTLPRKVLKFQTWLSLACGVVVLPALAYKLFTLSWLSYQWQYTFEMFALISVYPLIDLTNLRVLNRYKKGDERFDIVGHRTSNADVFALLVITTLSFFAASDHYYFFTDEQLPLMVRLCFDMTPFVIWMLTGRPFRFFMRSYRLSA